MLSSSLDWTVKLWHPKLRKDPLLTFESSSEYVYDCSWSPTCPSIFSSCDGEGFIDIWDLNKDIEAPIIRKKTGDRALNHLKWHSDGRKMVIGNSAG